MAWKLPKHHVSQANPSAVWTSTRPTGWNHVWGLPRGGSPPAARLSDLGLQGNARPPRVWLRTTVTVSRRPGEDRGWTLHLGEPARALQGRSNHRGHQGRLSWRSWKSRDSLSLPPVSSRDLSAAIHGGTCQSLHPVTGLCPEGRQEARAEREGRGGTSPVCGSQRRAGHGEGSSPKPPEESLLSLGRARKREPLTGEDHGGRGSAQGPWRATPVLLPLAGLWSPAVAATPAFQLGPGNRRGLGDSPGRISRLTDWWMPEGPASECQEARTDAAGPRGYVVRAVRQPPRHLRP